MKLDTILVRSGRPSSGPANPSVMRASTILFEDVDCYDRMQKDRFMGLRYGAYGTDTMFHLEAALTELEKCHRAIVVPTGLAAITASLSAIARPGGHMLVADCVYGPTRAFCEGTLKQSGVEVEYFDPLMGEGLGQLVRPNTQAIFCESPGSFTFEVADIPAFVKIAKANDIPFLLDNTWATPVFFDSMGHGVDVSIQAATKYINGHSDVLMGTIATSERWWRPIRDRVADLGFATSPDDCYLALRGLRTLGLRLRHQQASALEIAGWLQDQAGVRKVLHPALPGDPGHSIWKRDFTGASSLFGVELDVDDDEAIHRFVDSLRLFGIGASWGGFESLVLPARYTRTAGVSHRRPVSVRLHIGLEDPQDLKEDLSNALGACKGRRPAKGQANALAHP